MSVRDGQVYPKHHLAPRFRVVAVSSCIYLSKGYEKSFPFSLVYDGPLLNGHGGDRISNHVLRGS